MKNRNRCALMEYLVLFYAVTALSGAVYMLYLRALPFFSYATSRKVFVVFIFFSMMIGLLVSTTKDRNMYSIVSTLSIPIGTYTMVAYVKIYPVLITGIVFVFFAVLFALKRTVKRKYKSRKNIRHITNAAARALLCATCIFSVAVIGINNAFFANPNRSFNVGENPESNIFKSERGSGIDYSTVSFLQQFEETTWAELSRNGRMEALKLLCEYEMNYLGIAREVHISFVSLAGRHIQGASLPERGIILIDENYLTEFSSKYNAHEVMNTIIHEIFHIYEQELMELSAKLNEEEKKLLKFNSVNDYLLESESYISGSLDYSGYYNQSLEKDSRAYAQLRVNEYYYIIENQLTHKDLAP